MNEIAIVKQENIQTILSAAPQSYQDNKLSRQRCIEVGQTILNAIEQQGMTDELDRQAAAYIEKARKTVKKMNERRSPVTKLFDDIRKEFTAMENAIDVTKSDTVPFILQQHRNRFAAKKRAEEEERQRLEMQRQQLQQARLKLKQDVKDYIDADFRALVDEQCRQLNAMDSAVTLDNYEASLKHISEYPVNLPADYLPNLHAQVWTNNGITAEEITAAENEVKQQSAQRFAEQYKFEVESVKQDILDRLPTKKTHLERIALADAAEAERIKAEMEERQRAEAQRVEAERHKREEEEKAKADLARQQLEMSNLFDSQAVMQSYQPKVKVTKKIELLNPDGIMPILSMWWSKEGCRLPIDKLLKMFKPQIAFCENLANKEDVYLQDENLRYVEDVKAK